MPDDKEDTQSHSSSKQRIGGDEPTITMSDLSDPAAPGPDSLTQDEATISMAELATGEARFPARPAVKSTGQSTISMPAIDSTADRTAPSLSRKGAGGSVIGFILQERYKLNRVLGQGGFGEVYLAEDLKLKRRCIVKRMLVKQRSAKALEVHRLNFKREAELLTELNDPGHPNIPEIYDYFSDEAGNYLVMKYIEGRNLKELLKQYNGPLPGQDVLRYAYDLCDALHYMHTYDQKQPILHRDIKPANIILGDDNRIWLVDFGLAKALPVEDEESDHGLTKASGSLGYTPLEQWFGQPVPTSDVYALGATLHHLLTNLSPADVYGQGNFNIQILQQRHGQFVPIHKVNPQTTKALSDMVASALGPDPDQRPTALQLQQQLDILISGAQDAPLFTFKTGEAARSKGRLVDLCDRYRQEAQGYLYRGDFERWFRLTNHNDLAYAASKAVDQARNQQDGLERFLKLIFPNLFLRRMRRASLHTMRAGLFIFLGVVLTLSVSAVLGSYLTGFVIQRTVAGYPANFEKLEPTYTEFELNEMAQRNTAGAFDRIQVDVRPPDQIDINLNWSGILLFLTFEQVDQTPRFQLTEINGFSFPFPFDLLIQNVSRGLNRGLDDLFSQAPVDIVALEIREKTHVIEDELFVIDTIHLTIVAKSSGLSPAPTVPLNRPPVSSPSEAGQTRLLVFNQLDQAIILEVGGRSWAIPAGQKRLIETKAGTQPYTITRGEDGRLLSRGTRTWQARFYNLYIDFDDDHLQRAD